ncbi:MAG: DUF975 family protein [Lactobacillales bacterium]|nr:DUF975 family protein [Lactobacillales bacterium]
MNRTELKSAAKAQLRGNWLVYIVALIVAGGVSFSVSYVTSGKTFENLAFISTIASILVLFFVTIPFQATIEFFAARLSKGEKVEFADYGRPYQEYLRVLKAVLWRSLFQFLWGIVAYVGIVLGIITTVLAVIAGFAAYSANAAAGGGSDWATGLAAYAGIASVVSLLLIVIGIVPAILAQLRYTFALYVINDDPESNYRSALNRSKELTRGHKGELFVLQLSFIGWYILTAITCGILAFYVLPYANTTIANFYRKLIAEEEGVEFVAAVAVIEEF